MGRKNRFSPPPPQSFRCGSKQPYTLSHPEAWDAPFMTHDWSPSNVTDSAGHRSQSNKRNALTRLLEQARSHDLNRREVMIILSFRVKFFCLDVIFSMSGHIWEQLFTVLYLEHWMPSECGGTSRQTAPPTLWWWQQQYAGDRWCQASGFPGDAGSSLQVALPVRQHSRHWCDTTIGRLRLGHDSACLEGAAKTPGCPRDCCWWGWVQGHGGEL